MTTTRQRYRKHYEGTGIATTVEIVKEGEEYRVEVNHFRDRTFPSWGMAVAKDRAEALQLANMHADAAKKRGLVYNPEKTETECFA